MMLPSTASKEELLEKLVCELAKQNNIKNYQYLAQAILDREHESSTFLPTGIAIPHARVPDVPEILLIMGVLKEGFSETPGAERTHLIFLFFSPIKDKEFGRHLKLLARISSIFRDPSFVKEIASVKSAEEIFSLIQHKERENIEE